MPARKIPTTLRFMLAARRSELSGLEDLARTCELVTHICQLVHALQKERGYSNIYLSGNAPHHRQQLDSLSQAVADLEHSVRDDFERMDVETVGTPGKTLLYNRIAYALHSLDELPALRLRIREHRIALQDATGVFIRLIGGLLAVVFEAADTAADPDVTRCLVALFNFMQGKELAGQERAVGVSGFANGYFTTDMLERHQQLIESQERCFETFARFASDEACLRWQTLCDSDLSAQTRQFREIATRTSETAQVDRSLCELWFELQTQRIDIMQQVESRLAQDLLERCGQSIARLREELNSHRQLLDRLADMHAAAEQAKLFSIQASGLDSPPPDGMTAQVARTTLELLQMQNQRLQSLNDELREARLALNERKLIERGKQLLMEQYGLTESEAHTRLRQAAMNQGLRMEELAQRLLAMAGEQLPARMPRRPART